MVRCCFLYYENTRGFLFFPLLRFFSGGILWSLFGWFFKSLFIFVWTDKSKRRKVHRRSRWENFFPNPIPKADLEQAGSIFYEKWCSIKFYYWGRCSPWEKTWTSFPEKKFPICFEYLIEYFLYPNYFHWTFSLKSALFISAFNEIVSELGNKQ